MKELIGKIGQVILWLALLTGFASLGFASEMPGLMVPLLALVLILIIGGILLNLSKNKRHSYDKLNNTVYLNLIGGGLLLLLSLFFPMISFANTTLSTIAPITIFGFTILLTLLGFASIYLINVVSKKSFIYSILGFLLLIIVTSLPGLFVSQIDSSFGTLGTVYFVILIQAILVWFGFSLFIKKFQRQNP